VELPEKQGLKPSPGLVTELVHYVAVELPEKQGLKRRIRKSRCSL